MLALPGCEGEIIEAETVEVKAETGSEPLPAWAVLKLKTMTGKNWKKVRKEMLARNDSRR